MSSIDVPYHYEHAPKIQQGVMVENSNNWYIGARRVASPIVVLTEANAYNVDVPGRAKPEWDVIPGGNWTALKADPQRPQTPDAHVPNVGKGPASVQVVSPDEPNPAPAESSAPSAAREDFSVEVVSPWVDRKPSTPAAAPSADPAPAPAPAPVVAPSATPTVQLPPAPPSPPAQQNIEPAVVPAPLDLPRGIFDGKGGEFVKEAFERDGTLPK